MRPQRPQAGWPQPTEYIEHLLGSALWGGFEAGPSHDLLEGWLTVTPRPKVSSSHDGLGGVAHPPTYLSRWSYLCPLHCLNLITCVLLLWYMYVIFASPRQSSHQMSIGR